VEIVKGRVECVVAVAECGQGFVVAVDAGAQGAFEVGYGGAVDEVVEVLLRRARRLQDGLDGRFAQDCEG
jgi:hypothetical protein